MSRPVVLQAGNAIRRMLFGTMDGFALGALA
jgi:hypothetical protein